MQHGRDRVFARLASPQELEELQLNEPTAVMVTCHTAWDTEGRPLTYEEGIAPPERWTAYEYEIGS
jgi:GntR family transcriptional regulator